MARLRLISMIDEEISKVEADLTRARGKCEALSARLLELQKLKQDCEDKVPHTPFDRHIERVV